MLVLKIKIQCLDNEWILMKNKTSCLKCTKSQILEFMRVNERIEHFFCQQKKDTK